MKKKKREKETEKEEVTEQPKEKKLKKKWIIILVVILLVVALVIGACFLIPTFSKGNKQDQEKNEMTEETPSKKDRFDFVAGASLEEIKLQIKENNGLNENAKITIVNSETGEEVKTIIKYYDKEGNEVSKEEATEVVLEKEQLKEGFTQKEFLVGVGDFKAKVEEDEKTYEVTIQIEDKEAPILLLQEVSIEEGNELKIESFVKSCVDNSNETCQLNYVNDANEIIESVDLSVGERIVKIIASDTSGNKTEAQEIKLTVTAKPPVSTSPSKGGSSSSSGGSSSSADNNPIVKAAKSMLGQTGVPCTDVAEKALNAVGKSLWIEIIADVYDRFTGTYLGYGQEAYNKAQEDRHICQDTTGTDTGYTTERCYYAKKNKIYKVINRSCYQGKCEEEEDTTSSYLGEQLFYITKGPYYTESNIKKIAKNIPLSSIKPGDFLFYENGGNGYTHIAVYIGDNKAVHGGWESKHEVVIFGIYLGGNATVPTAWRVSY